MRIRFVMAVALAALGAATGLAQEKPAPASSGPVTQSTAPAQARITVVISRQQGDRKLSSLPYMFGVASGERTNLRMGSEVPIGSKSSDGTTLGASPVSYRSIGTNIDCVLNPAGAGLYRVQLVVEDSSVHLDREQKSGNPAVTNDYPSFRSFKTSFIALLRDGQTMQHTSATDPLTGEVMRVDVTLNVLK